ncbi:MAG: flavodoxin family protein [Deltaproteobacteria bacterium]|nr:flavodoxin family protein [Deltaproteobacteria bacterium]MBW2085414.1 flavodoxin family protein [Deltaproteobacteria bacterium]
MKILGLVCSPRKGGNTEILVNEALEAARKAGAETELILVADKNIAPCDGCGSCVKDGDCIVEDDMQPIYQQLEQADGIIFGTPVYFINVSAQAKAIIDRTYAFLRTQKLRGKVAAAIVAVRRVGASQVLSLLYSYFAIQRMIIAGGGIGYGREKGEVRQGPGGSPTLSALEEARAVGRNVVRMVQKQY